MLSERNKKILIKVAILFGAFVVAGGILTGMIFLAKGFGKTGLKAKIEQTLEIYEPDSYTVGDFVKLKSHLSAETAVFKCRKARGGQTLYAVILRMSTLAGPCPAVFVCSQNSADFAGFAIDNGKAEAILNPSFNELHIQYWKDSLSSILVTAGLFDD